MVEGFYLVVQSSGLLVFQEFRLGSEFQGCRFRGRVSKNDGFIEMGVERSLAIS